MLNRELNSNTSILNLLKNIDTQINALLSYSSLNLLPKDIIYSIFELMITENIHVVLVLRLSNKILLAITERLSLIWLHHYLPEIVNQLSSYQFGCTLFRTVHSESRRLQLTPCILKNSIIKAEKFHLRAGPALNREKLPRYRQATRLLFDELNVDYNFNLSVINREDEALPAELNSFIISGVAARAYEFLNKLFQLICLHENINTDRVIDAIYTYAIQYLYNEIEFVQLITCIPIDINRQLLTISYEEDGKVNSDYQPLFYQVALTHNVNLLIFLIHAGIDHSQLASYSESMIEILKNIDHTKCILIENYLTKFSDEQHNTLLHLNKINS